MENPQTKNRLLLVDGDPKSLRVLDVSLKKAGFQVTTATSGREALASLGAHLPDLIISDTDLQEMDGFELCNRIKANSDWAKIPFLFVSSRKSIEDKIRGLELGVDDYLTKPIYIKEIGIRVRTALQRAERERMESRREGRTRFAGALSDVGVVDLVQTIELNRKSGIIHIVNHDDRRGSIFFRDGKVIDAEVGRLSGAHALYRLFSWSEGQFAVEFKHIRRHDVVDLSMAALMMEGMRRLDESAHLLENLPSLNHVLEVDCRVLAEELAELPDEMNSVLRLCDGARTLQEVVEDSDLPDLETLTIISKLYLGQIIFARQPPEHGGEPQPGVRLANWLSEGGAEAPAIPPEPADDAQASSAVELSASKAVLLPGDQALPHTGDILSAEETLGAALPSRADARAEPVADPTLAADTLKGIPVESLFADQPAPLSPPKPAPSPHPRDEGRITTPMGLAERLLSADSALHAATMHEVMGDADGRVSEPQPVDRHTQSYGDPAAQAAALVQEVVSSAHTSHPPPPVQPARPIKEVDWGAWPADSAVQSPPQPGVFVVNPVAPPPAAPSELAPTDIQELSTADVLPEEPKPIRAAPESRAPQADDAYPIEQEAAAAGSPPPCASDQPAADLIAPPNSSPAARISLVPPSRDEAATEPSTAPSSSSQSSGISSSDALLAIRDSSQTGRLWLILIAGFGLGIVGAFAFCRKDAHQDEASSTTPLEPPSAVEKTAPAPALPIAAAPVPSANPPPAVEPAPPHATPEGLPSSAQAPAPKNEPSEPTITTPLPEAAALRQKCLDTNADGKGKAKAVAAACRPLLEAEPKDAEIMVILARAEIDRGRFAEARLLAKRALASDPQRLEAYVYLGTAEQASGKVEEARAAYKKYLDLAPDGPYARELRAILSNI